MNMSSIYANRHLIPEKYEAKFLNDHKHDLNTVEMVGLEAILCEFVRQPFSLRSPKLLLTLEASAVLCP